MLPVVATPAVVAQKILVYSYVMVAVTLGLAPYAGWIYTACAVGLGAWFLVEAHRLRGRVAAMPGVGDPGPAQPAGPAGGRPANAVQAGLLRDDSSGASPADAGRSSVATAVDTAIGVDVAVDAAAEAATAEAAGVPGATDGACAGLVKPSANPAPMRLFHLSIAYLTLLFAVIAVTAVLPWGSW
jgi:heme O synthase-like polyprenyltransferase